MDMIFASTSLLSQRIVDLGAEHCLEWDITKFFQFTHVEGLGCIQGVGGVSSPIIGHGYIGEWVKTDKGSLMLIVFYARCVPSVRYRLRSGYTLATCGVRQETELYRSSVRTRLTNTDADGTTHYSTCVPVGRLFATRHLGTVTPAQARRMGIEKRCHTQIHAANATGGHTDTDPPEAPTDRRQTDKTFTTRHLGSVSPAQARRLGIEARGHAQDHAVNATGGHTDTAPPEATTDRQTHRQTVRQTTTATEWRADARALQAAQATGGRNIASRPNTGAPQHHGDDTVLLTLSFQRLRAATGGATAPACAKLLHKWDAQETAVGQRTQRTKVSHRDTEEVRRAVALARAKTKPLSVVDTPAMQQHVGAMPEPLQFGAVVGGDGCGGDFGKSIDGKRYLHIWQEMSTGSLHVSTEATKQAACQLRSVREAARHWGLPWNFSENANAGITICHDNSTSYEGVFKRQTARWGMENRYAYTYAKGKAFTPAIEKANATIADRVRTNLVLAEPACKREGLNVVTFTSPAALAAGVQHDISCVGPDGKVPWERRKHREMTRNEFLRHQPTHFYGEGTAAVPAPVRVKPKRATASAIGSTNKTLADRGERVAFMYTDNSDRWMVYGFTCKRIYPCMSVTWDVNTPNAPNSTNIAVSQDLDLVDWDKVALERRHLDPHRRTNAMVPRTYPQLDVLAAISRAIDNDHGTEFTVPLDGMSNGDRAVLVAANAAAIQHDPEHDMDRACTLAFATVGAVTDTATGSPSTGTGAAAADSLVAELKRAATSTAAASGDSHLEPDVSDLRSEIFALYASGAYHDGVGAFMAEAGGVGNESDLIDTCDTGQYALMRCATGLHVIDTHGIDAMVAKTDQPDPREQSIDALSYDALRVTKQQNQPVPKSITRALQGEYGRYWLKAWNKEIGSFREDYTYRRVLESKIKRGSRRVRMMVVLSRKYNPDGTLSRLKCRAVVLGHLLPKREGEVTSSSMPRLPLVRLMDHIAMKLGLQCFAGDLGTCFLEGELTPEDSDIYVIVPKFMQEADPGRWFHPDTGEPYAMHLLKSCYGLRTAAADWERTRDKYCLGRNTNPADNSRIPLLRSSYDASLYYLDKDKLCDDPNFAELRQQLVGAPATNAAALATQHSTLRSQVFWYLIYTDDHRCYTTSSTMNSIWMAGYSTRFTVTGGRVDVHDNGIPEEYLGMMIEYARVNGRLRSQWSCDPSLEKFLREHKADKLHATDAPMNPDTARLITKDAMPRTDADKQRELDDLKATKLIPDDWTYEQLATNFRSITAGGNWYACTVYPLLSFCVSRLSTQMAAPTATAYRAAKKLLRHMRGLTGKHLRYQCGESADINLVGQSDASLGDSDEGRSQFAWTMQLDERVSAVFDWKSGKTAYTIISTMGTELYALSELARSCRGWQMLLEEIGVGLNGPAIIYTDSTSALLNASQHTTHSRSRAVRLRSWFVREAVDQGVIKVMWRSGNDLHVDGLTKAKPGPAHQRQQNEAMGYF